jgi:hypothetical protein
MQSVVVVAVVVVVVVMHTCHPFREGGPFQMIYDLPRNSQTE